MIKVSFALFAFTLATTVFLTNCGVKGDPLPPLHQPELSRGKPTYKSATKEISLKLLPEEETEEDKKNKKNKLNK